MHYFRLFFVAFIFVNSVNAETWTRPPAGIDIFGKIQITTSNQEETLLDIARQYEIGQIEILLANPDVDRWLPGAGTKVVLPNRYIIPQAERVGLVLNLPEMRIYYFPKTKKREKPVVMTYPVSIGRMDWETPLGKTKIVGKKKDPTWTPPQSLKDEAIAAGDQPLLDVVPAGPDNPLGRYAMRLGTSNGSYLIHGTNKPYGVGMRVSHGCIRMYPENIEYLFEKVPIGTQVQLINQPIKIGWLIDSLFIELHAPLEEDTEKHQQYRQKVLEMTNEFIKLQKSNTDSGPVANLSIDSQALEQAITEMSGIPVLISQ